MNITAIVFSSNTGFTERYARAAGEKTGLPVYSVSDIKKLDKNSSVIYMGWLMASTVKDYKKIAKRFDVKAVCAVGLCETGCLIDEAKKASKIPDEVPLFTLQGGLIHEKLRGIYKFMINMLIKMLSSKKDKTDAEKAMLDMIVKGGDLFSENNLSSFLDWYNNR